MAEAEIYDINDMRAVRDLARLSHKEKVAREFGGYSANVTPWPVVPRPIPPEAPVDISHHFSPEAYASKIKLELKNFGDVVIMHVGCLAWQELLENELRILKEGK